MKNPCYNVGCCKGPKNLFGCRFRLDLLFLGALTTANIQKYPPTLLGV